MKYKVVLIESDEGYAVICPALPGCSSQGQTRDEALANIRDAIHDWLEVTEENLLRRFKDVPATSEVVTV